MLIGGGACAILCMWIDIPLLQMFLFTVVLVSGIGSQVLSIVTVESFPTSLRYTYEMREMCTRNLFFSQNISCCRAMAVCISFLIGRIGCMFGSNLTGLLLENHCETAFYISGTLLIGKSFKN